LNDNWDGNGSVAPDAIVFDNAKKFLSELPLSILNELTSSKIVPTPYGTLVFDWEKGFNLVSIEIGNNEIGFFTDFIDGQNAASDGIPINENHFPSALLPAFKKLFYSPR
jgi:hypothetical protein